MAGRNPCSFGGRPVTVVRKGALFEEVSLVERGGNYGWNVKEGTHCFDPTSPTNPLVTTDTAGPRGSTGRVYQLVRPTE